MTSRTTDAAIGTVTLDPYTGDTSMLRSTFAAYPSGIAALAATVSGERTVLVASSFTVGVSMDPPLVLFAVQNSSTTWPTLAQAPVIGVSILGVEHTQAVRELAGKDKSKRLTRTEVIELDSAALLIQDAPILLECRIVHDYPAGDHSIIVLQVISASTTPTHTPLVFYNSTFHQPLLV